jgi:histone deacetylase complex subunit SAP30
MAWNTTPLSLLNTYRVSHNLATPAAFTSPLNQALLVNPGIGRQSPTMARRKDKRRVSKEQLATNVRKHFNSAAVNEIDVVVELVYKSRNKGTSYLIVDTPQTCHCTNKTQTKLFACAQHPASRRNHDRTPNL